MNEVSLVGRDVAAAFLKNLIKASIAHLPLMTFDVCNLCMALPCCLAAQICLFRLAVYERFTTKFLPSIMCAKFIDQCFMLNDAMSNCISNNVSVGPFCSSGFAMPRHLTYWADIQCTYRMMCLPAKLVLLLLLLLQVPLWP